MTEISTQTLLLFDVFLLLEGNADTWEEFSTQNQFYHPKKVPHLGKDEHELASPHNLILQFECFLEGPSFQSLKQQIKQIIHDMAKKYIFTSL